MAVVFNLFHAATHFATQFNLTTPFQKFEFFLFVEKMNAIEVKISTTL